MISMWNKGKRREMPAISIYEAASIYDEMK